MEEENELSYSGPERRQNVFRLSDTQLEEIADLAYKRATERIYLEIGKGVVRAAAYIIGTGLLALAAWLGLSEKIK